jgi:hypothetical protein
MTKAPAERKTGEPARNSMQFMEWLVERTEQDGDNLSLRIAAKQLDAILACESEGEVWDVVDSGGTIASKELEDKEVSVRGFIVRPESGEFDAPLKHYMVADCVRLDTGEEILVNTSSPLIMGLLYWYERKQAFPKSFVIRGYRTPKGRRLGLERLTERQYSPPTAHVEDDAS